MREYRLDRAARHADFSGDLAAPVDGRVFEGRIARTHSPGDALMYSDGPEYRDVANLQAIVDQMPGKPFTLGHPAGLIRDGVEARIVGKILSARIENDHAVATILVTDTDALAAIDAGTVELSLGYSCTLDENRYQTDIAIDHLSLVAAARCGASCALRADCLLKPISPESLDEIEDPTTKSACGCKIRAIPHNSNHMSDVKSTEVVATTEVVKADAIEIATNKDPVMDELKAALAAATAALATETARGDAATLALETATLAITQANLDAKHALDTAEALKASIDADKAAALAAAEAEKIAAVQAVEATRSDAAASIPALVKARVALETQATLILGVADRADASDRDIKCAVVASVDGAEIAADASPAYVDGMFDGACRRFNRTTGSRVDTRVAIQKMRSEGVTATTSPRTGPVAEKAASAAMAKRISQRWNSQEQE